MAAKMAAAILETPEVGDIGAQKTSEVPNMSG